MGAKINCSICGKLTDSSLENCPHCGSPTQVGRPPAPPTPELDDRKAAVLLAVVRAYVRVGEPVGSKRVVDEAGLSVSAATVCPELNSQSYTVRLTPVSASTPPVTAQTLIAADPPSVSSAMKSG